MFRQDHSMTLIKQLKHFDDVDNHQDLEYRISSNSDAFDTFPIYLTVDDAILYSLSGNFKLNYKFLN